MSTQHTQLTQWNIVSFPWHIDDEFMYQYIHDTVNMYEASATMVMETASLESIYMFTWSHRTLTMWVNP